MRYLELLENLQNLTQEKLTDRRMMQALDLRTPSAITYKKNNNSFVTDDEIEKIENSFNVKLNGDIPYITLDYYPDVFASCGNGLIPFGYTKEKKRVPVNLINGYSEHKRFVVVNAKSDSMMPEIKPNDLLIIRVIDAEPIIDNHIYVFCHDERLYCKYLSYNVGQVIVRSANKDYPIRYIEGKNLESFRLHGEVCGHFRSYIGQ